MGTDNLAAFKNQSVGGDKDRQTNQNTRDDAVNHCVSRMTRAKTISSMRLV
jgi:hypothetical protein